MIRSRLGAAYTKRVREKIYALGTFLSLAFAWVLLGAGAATWAFVEGEVVVGLILLVVATGLMAAAFLMRDDSPF
jgi:hypothetical protein